MKMFFHTGVSEYILFQSWVPHNESEYTIACFVMFLVAFIYEALVTLHVILEVKWLVKDKRAACFPAMIDDSKFTYSLYISSLSIIIKRGVLKFISATIGYSMMLVIMTFNIGLFFSIVSGLTLGCVCFNGYIRRSNILCQTNILGMNLC